MEFDGILTGILAFPFVGAIIILMLGKEDKLQARWIALFATVTSLALGFLVFATYDVDTARADNAQLNSRFEAIGIIIEDVRLANVNEDNPEVIAEQIAARISELSTTTRRWLSKISVR